MSTPQPTFKSGPKMKIAIDPKAEAIKGAPQEQGESSVSDDGVWLPMESAPKNGKFIYLQGDEDHAEWYYYRTREFFDGHWEPTGWWRKRFGDKDPPKFKLTGYQLVSKPIL